MTEFGAVRRAWIPLSGNSGRAYYDVDIVGETAKCYRIRALPGQRLYLPGRIVEGDKTSLVRKDCVQFGPRPA